MTKFVEFRLEAFSVRKHYFIRLDAIEAVVMETVDPKSDKVDQAQIVLRTPLKDEYGLGFTNPIVVSKEIAEDVIRILKEG